MKALITGGAGFIGSAVVPAVSNDGYDVFVLDNLSFGNRDFINVRDDHFFLADIRDELMIENIFEKLQPELIIHLAAIHFIPYCNQHPYEAADTNVRGTINILKAARKDRSLQKLFFASTAAVYPIEDTALKEDHRLHPMDIYGLSKLTGEHLCHELYLETGIDTIICRFFNAFGPNETNPHLIPEIESQLRKGLRTIKLGNLTPKRDFIHTYDMASAVRKLIGIKKKGYDIYNLGRGIEYSVAEIVEAFERQIKEKVHIEVDQQKVRKVEREHLLADVSKLKSIGWEPEWGIDEGVKNLIENW